MPQTVSVVIPAYNSSTTIEATLQSVFNQTFRDFEIVVVDDGSTDATRQILERLQATDSRLAVIHQSNSGVAIARNTGIKASKGAYIAFLDADDLWHPTKLEKQVAVLSQCPPDVAMVYCWSRLIDEEDAVIASVTPLRMSEWVFNQHVYINPLGNGSGLLIRKKAARKIGGFDDALRAEKIPGAEDLLFQLRIAANWKARVVPEYLVGYRMTRSNFSADKERMYRSIIRSIDLASRDAGRFPHKAARWSKAAFLFDLISYHLIRKHPVTAVGRGIQAIVCDPKMVLDRLAFAIRKRTTTHMDASVGHNFDQVDPGQAGHPVSHLMRKRLTILARLDAEAHQKHAIPAAHSHKSEGANVAQFGRA